MTSRLSDNFDQAISLHRRGNLTRARILYERVLAEDALHFDALHLSGVIAAQCGDPGKAAQLIGQAILADGNNPSLYAALNNLGNALQQMRQPEAALLHLERALALKPDFAEAHRNRGTVLQDLERFTAAMSSFDRAVALNMSDAGTHYCRGNCLQAMGRPLEAVASYQAAVAIKPDFVLAHLNRGNALRELARFAEALGAYEAALKSDRNCAEAQLGKATLLLLQGNYADGLRLYEWRWKTANAPSKLADKRQFGRPAWRGDTGLSGKTILVHHEQGLGDCIQFARYAQLLQALGAAVILEVRQPLARLMQSLDGPQQILKLGEPLPGFDLHVPTMSLPYLLKTRLDSIPAAARYLEAEPPEVAEWQARLGPRTRARVGIAWRGNPRHENDSTRSIPLKLLLDHLPDGIDYVSLQFDMPEAERALLATSPIRYFPEGPGDFKRAAALAECMDLVISVDTSCAHLAGALGLETWLLLSANPDWRWLLGRADSPWYPTLRLERQERPGDWPGVLARVAQGLRMRFAP